MRRFLVLLILCACLCGLSCGSDTRATETPTPSPTPATLAMAATLTEQEFQGYGDDPENRNQARQAAIAFLKTKWPDCAVKGIASERYGRRIYWIDLDVQQKDKAEVVTLEVRKFFPEDNGPSYWRAVPINRLREDQMTELEEVTKAGKPTDE